ncbi:MAG: DUF4249 domain-containing protein [Paludibacteraceae bacterium]
MRTKHIYLAVKLLIFAGLFSSCEKVIEFNGERTKPLLVMNSILKADSIVRVHISKSRFFLDNDNEMSDINNAAVKLWINDAEQETLRFVSEGDYYSSYKTKLGDNIKITASANSFNDISSTAIIPEVPQVISIDTVYTYENDGGYISQILNFDIKFTDKSNTDDYYLVYCIQRVYQDYIYEGKNYQEYDMYLFSDDIVFENENNGNFAGEDIFGSMTFNAFTDDLINGKEYSLRMKSYVQGYGADYQQKKLYALYFQKISKAWYLYLRTTSLVNSDFSMFSEPVQVYTNIQNGLGILGATNSFKKEFHLGE